MKRVVVGLSGGVDSSVAAYLLQEQGYEVIGVFMRNWNDESVIISEECPWIEDSNDALLVAEKLGIPFQTIDFSNEYKERIVDYMFREYEAGRTPNPDVLCNREVKFDLFLKKALELGADFVATGHYCRKETIEKEGKSIHRLLAGKDNNKDQSYFLCQVSQKQLAKALFPIGELQKYEVREIAKELDLITAEKKDSQGLCFIGKVRLPDFLQQQLKSKQGNIIEIDNEHPMYARDWNSDNFQELAAPYHYEESMGKKVGRHQGAHYFTIGQRKGMNVGGTPLPLFVIATDTKTNTIYVGQGTNHKGLYRKTLFIPNEDIHWTREDLAMNIGEERQQLGRIRYRQGLEKCTLYRQEKGLYITFDEMQRGIAAGQFAAWYDGEELIGSGVIS
ncbi:MAG: tRNA 2-thiouridine(34) synthase MnmA [Chitinophagales bacterium]